MAELVGIIQGMAELQKCLELMSAIDGRRGCSKALRAGTKLIAEEARRLAPVRKGRKGSRKGVPPEAPGSLKKSIKTRAMKRKRNRVGFVVRCGDTDETVSKPGYTGKQFYGAFLEFGTAKMPPHPFMRPAYDNQKEAAMRVIGEGLWDAVAAAARGGADT